MRICDWSSDVCSSDLLAQYLDITMLGFYVPPAQIGIYDIAVKITSLLSFVMVAVSSLGAPRFSFLYASRDIEGLQSLINKILHLAFWPIAFGAVLMVLGGGMLLAIFGPEFREGETALGIQIGRAACRDRVFQYA